MKRTLVHAEHVNDDDKVFVGVEEDTSGIWKSYYGGHEGTVTCVAGKSCRVRTADHEAWYDISEIFVEVFDN